MDIPQNLEEIVDKLFTMKISQSIKNTTTSCHFLIISRRGWQLKGVKIHNNWNVGQINIVQT